MQTTTYNKKREKKEQIKTKLKNDDDDYEINKVVCCRRDFNLISSKAQLQQCKRKSETKSTKIKQKYHSIWSLFFLLFGELEKNFVSFDVLVNGVNVTNSNCSFGYIRYTVPEQLSYLFPNSFPMAPTNPHRMLSTAKQTTEKVLLF